MVKLSDLYDLSKFDGIVSEDDKDLDEFLKKDALIYQNQRTAITYLCIWKENIVGFVTISADCVNVEVNEKKEIEKKFPHNDFPALKIARLLVDKKYRGCGIGKYMVLQSAKLALETSEKIGMRLLCVDAKQQSIGFYEKLGFRLLMKTQKRVHPRLYFDLFKSSFA